MGQKQKTEKKKREKEKKERPKVCNNNGQLHIATPPRVVNAKPPRPKLSFPGKLSLSVRASCGRTIFPGKFSFCKN